VARAGRFFREIRHLCSLLVIYEMIAWSKKPPLRRQDILSLLEGGDRRSIGRADQVAAMVGRKPELFAGLMAGLWSRDPMLRMRAADAAEKVTREKPALLAPHKKELLGLMAESAQAEVRWHLAVMVPRLALTAKERDLAMSRLREYLEDRSAIVKTMALQAMADLAEQDCALRAEVVEILRQATRSGTAAMKARSRKLLLQVEGGA
jgi:hypothetical protein